MAKKIVKKGAGTVKTVLILCLSCFLCSMAVNWVALPNGFPSTGIAGLALTAQSLCGINYALIYYGITFIILVVTMIVFGAGELRNILFLSVLYPAVLWVMNHFTVSIILSEKLLAAALFGVLNGAGTGLAMRIGYSYGGLDTCSKILKRLFFRAAELRNIMLGIDVVILVLMLTVFSLDEVAYAFVGELITTNFMNYVIFNIGPKLYEVQIISDDKYDLDTFIINNLHRSLTLHPARGGYSGQEKVQMDCVCTLKEFVNLRQYLMETDPNCFIKVLPLTHVFGVSKDYRKLDDQNV